MDSAHPSSLPFLPSSSSASSSYQTIYPPIRWNDIIGMHEPKRAIQEILYLPYFIEKTLFTGIRTLPSTILLYGPPGTGKTMLAYATAYESQRKLYTITPSSILSKWAGESEKTLRKIFNEAAGLSSIPSTVHPPPPPKHLPDDYGTEMDSGVSSQSTTTPTYPYSSVYPTKRSRVTNMAVSHRPHPPSYRETDSFSSPPYTDAYVDNSLSVSMNTSIDGSSNTPLPVMDNGIIFIDEIDAFVIRRDNGDNPSTDGGGSNGSSNPSIDTASRRLLNEFLLLLSDLPNRYPNILVIAATNRIHDCDQAILRRFQRRIYCSLPTFNDRYHLMVNILKDIAVDMDTKEFEDIAEVTEGWNNSDLRALCTEAAMVPVREIIQQQLDTYLSSLSSSTHGNEHRNPYPHGSHPSHGNLRSPCTSSSSTATDTTKPFVTSLRPLTIHDFSHALRTIRPSYIDGNTTMVPHSSLPYPSPDPVIDTTLTYDAMNNLNDDNVSNSTGNPSVTYSLSSHSSSNTTNISMESSSIPTDTKIMLLPKGHTDKSIPLTIVPTTIATPSYVLLPSLPSGMRYIPIRTSSTDHDPSFGNNPGTNNKVSLTDYTSEIYDNPLPSHDNPNDTTTTTTPPTNGIGLPSTIHASINAFVHRFEETEDDK